MLYSARVYKWNKFTIKQERVLVVTNINVYNFHKKSNPLRVNEFRGAQSDPHLWVGWSDKGIAWEKLGIRHSR